MRRSPWGLYAVALLLPFVGVVVTLVALVDRPRSASLADEAPRGAVIGAFVLSVLITGMCILAWFASELLPA